jgi:hypothetical protein
MNETAHAIRHSGSHYIRSTFDIDAIEVAFVRAGLTERGSEMADAIHAIERIGEGTRIQNVTAPHVGAEAAQMLYARSLPGSVATIQPDNSMLVHESTLDEVRPDEAGGATNENPHQLALEYRPSNCLCFAACAIHSGPHCSLSVPHRVDERGVARIA